MQAAAARKLNHLEIYGGFSDGEAAVQASRCSQCGIPFCQVHCPLQNNIPDWLKLVAEGRLREAYELSSATNTFPEICGRICPQDKLCEGNCVIEKDFGSVTIGAVEKYITENAFQMGYVKPITPKHENGLSVGIIGAGPAGLAAAESLRRMGYMVDIYDRYDRAGGLLIYGIPSFKLEKHVVTRRQSLLEQGGIKFYFHINIGSNASFHDLREKHDAVLIATGVYKARELDFDIPDLTGVIPALAYLTFSNKQVLGITSLEYASGDLSAAGKDVVVIGGGDTAMDCVRTAVRQNAKSVKCLYRRDRASMPGSKREVKNAEEEGVEFIWQTLPTKINGNAKVESVSACKTRISHYSGRQNLATVEHSDFNIKADMVIKALGFDAEDLPGMFGEAALSTRKNGTIKTSSGYQTSLPGVFAAGDIVRGASLVVWAIREGREAAQQMHKYMSDSITLSHKQQASA